MYRHVASSENFRLKPLPSHEIEAVDRSTNSVELGMLGCSGAYRTFTFEFVVFESTSISFCLTLQTNERS